VQDKKLEMLETADKTANSQKQIAFITTGDRMEKFVIKAREIFEEFGYIVHWYHYPKEILKELDIGIEIADLRPHYHKLFRFDDSKLCFDFAYMGYLAAVKLAKKFKPNSVCTMGSDKWFAQALVNYYVEENIKVSCVPFGFEPFYSSIFENDITIVCDPRTHINCYPIYKPVIKTYPWNTVNDEDRNVFDLSEEIILKVVEERC
jgi:hypothetical protein